MRHPSLIPLSHDHHHGLALALRCRKQALGQLKPMGLKGLKERAQELRDFFANNLVRHFRAEEEALFPKLRQLVPESAALLDQLARDHRQIRDAISQLDGEIALGKLVFDLGDLLERHIRKEERELFPLFEQHIGETGAETVGDEIKKILEARPVSP
ncbi:MAG TPA: hemerythrin domain-containing protein [Candidatus Binatia bacterium]|nr:hemerythrin domain-containing protein [Candidatus Binatia bacterium]